MTEQQLTRSERIASRIMRSLAVVGIVAILAFASWLIVQGVRLLPRTGEGLGAAVTMITSFFNPTPEDPLAFTFVSNTFSHGDPAVLSWNYESENPTGLYALSYTCVEGVSFSVSTKTGWTDLPCNTPVTVDTQSATVIPNATKTRFTDVPITVTVDAYTDTRTITIINSDLSSMPATDEAAEQPVATSTPTAPKPEEKPVVTPAPAPRPQVPAPAPVVIRKPADLAVNINATGVLSDVKGRDTFFELDPIPDTKTAAVKFTVVNQGTVQSGSWTFVAYLPTEGDNNYRYVSPVQRPLDGGASVEFTLGFDDVLQEKTGTIRVTIRPTDASDIAVNNTDAVTVNIK